MSKTLNLIASICSILSFTYILIPEEYSKKIIDFNWLTVNVSIILLIVSILFLIIKGIVFYLKKRGNVNFLIAIRRFSPIILFKVILEIHECQHLLEESRLEINELKNTKDEYLINKKKRSTIALLLLKFKNIIDIITGSDVSVHIKLFEKISKEQLDESTTKAIDKLHLRTFERIPSKQEKKSRENSILECRSNNKLFVTYKWSDDFITKYSTKEEKEKLNKEDLYINSAYSQVLGKNSHTWISNNLKKDKERGKYFSNNPDETKYYNSLGVFLIGPVIRDGEECTKPAAGLLIFDSQKKNIFDIPFIRQVVGYISHRIYFYLTFIN